MYSVPIVPPDLRHEETIIQATNALDYLQKTIVDVFDRIDARIERNHRKIGELRQRIETAHSSINGLVGINKAIKIFSPAKFPATHVFQDIPITFNSLKDPPKFELNRNYEVVSSLEPVSHRNIQDKLVFYHVRTSMQTKKTKAGRLMEQKQGLGPMPENVDSVNALLMFNTSENVYQQDGVADSSVSKVAAKRKEKTSYGHGQKIEAPPISMSSRKMSDKKPNPGLFYSPRINEAPALDLPMDLPDLPGIADDITFNVIENERIAPSFYIDNLPDLPEPESISANSNEMDSGKIVDVPPVIVQSAPPPPPQPPAVIVKNAVTVTPSPPPPPPPPPTVLALLTPPAKAATSPSTPAADVSSAHMNLMEAIRNTGGLRGAKLKTAAAAEVTKANDTGEKKAGSKPSGDLMADLHNKLLMRRKGISGAKEHGASGTGSDSGNVLDRLSALIPPPPPKTAPVAANNSATDASDDNDDWTD